MAQTHKRVAANRAEDIIKQLRMSNLRTLWFDKFGPQMGTLLSRAQILEGLEIDTEGMNALEMRGIDSLLGGSLHHLKKFAQKRKYNWVEVYLTDPETEERRVYYGFTTELEDIDANVERFDKYKRQYQIVARVTKQLGELQRREITGKIA